MWGVGFLPPPHRSNPMSITTHFFARCFQMTRKDVVDAPLSARLGALQDWIGDGTYLEGRFTAGDLVMTTVIREVDDAVLARFPALLSYLERCQERPAFARALEAQLADFNDTS